MIPEELKQRWNLHVGKSCDVLPQLLEGLGTVDCFLHDSYPSYEIMTNEYECAWSHLRDGGYLLSTDTHRNAALFDFARRYGLELEMIKGIRFVCKV